MLLTKMKLQFAQGAKMLSLNVLESLKFMFSEKEKHLDVQVSRPLGEMAAEKLVRKRRLEIKKKEEAIR
jgi:hypothetical protein